MHALVGFTAIFCGFAQITRCDDEKSKPFTPPTSKIRERAIGSTLTLNRKLRKVFVPGDDFKPIRKPGPADWLANHSEPGQTVRQFIAAKPNRPDRRRHIIYLQPIGEFDPKQV